MIYVEKTGVAKLCDFGLARLMPFGVTAIDPKHLGTGGTPAYQGPEVNTSFSIPGYDALQA